MNGKPTRFEIKVDAQALDDLKQRLRNTRWSDDFGNSSGDYGLPSGWLRDMVSYWADGFDWPKYVQGLNGLEQYRIDISGVPVHYVHFRGVGENPIPIILSHGWPWTFLDFCEVGRLLSNPRAAAIDSPLSFDVIVPSLPGFGYSSPLGVTGIDAIKVAGLWTTLMRDVLGYERFIAGGGDWGASVSGLVGHLFPDAVKGVWLALPRVPGLDLRGIGEDQFAGDEQWMVERMKQARPTIQSHFNAATYEPQTLAYALEDSPAGMAAWIWTRRWNWSDHGGRLEDVYSRDFLCATAAIYWFTRTMGSSMRIYREQFGRGPGAQPPNPAISVPTAFAVFPRELLMIPRRVAQERTNLAQWTVHAKGGHFAPSEQPLAVANDIMRFAAAL